MQNEFEQPENAPVSTRAESPVKMKLEYKPGKTPEQYAKHANPKEDAKVGFLYYDKELKRDIKLDSVTLFVLGVYSQVSGAVKITEKEYRNYQTNLVVDTRQDIMVLKEAFVKNAETLKKGLYREVKSFVDADKKRFDGVGYRMVFVAYVRELDKVVHLECSQRLQYAFKKSIAAATKERTDKVNLFGLSSLSTEIWAFKFSGEYSLVDESDNEYSGKGNLYCAPVLSCGVIKPVTKNYEVLFPYLSSVQDQMRDYITAQQAYYGSEESNRQRAEPTPQNKVDEVPLEYANAAKNDFESPVKFDDSSDLPF